MPEFFCLLLVEICGSAGEDVSVDVLCHAPPFINFLANLLKRTTKTLKTAKE
jgi:hypothetical protein